MRGWPGWKPSAALVLVTAVVIGAERPGWERSAAMAVIVAWAVTITAALAVTTARRSREWASIAAFARQRRALR